MKLRYWFCLAFVALFALVAAAQLVTPGLPTSRYPNISTADNSDLINIARTNTAIGLGVRTNHNMLMRDVFAQASNGLASVTLVTATSNGLFNIITLTSNGLVTYVNVTSNSLFNSLLNVSNFLATSSIDVKTNPTMMVLQQTPNAGSQWYVGTNGTPTTNEARSGLEFNAFWRSLRMGEVFGGSDIYGLVGNGSNYWNNTNLGPVTVGFGSNAYVKAAFSSVLGGRNNAILTNAENSVIGGGIDNLIDTNSINCVIAGGGRNSIRSTNTGSPATLPFAHVTIGGGSNNNVLGLSKWSTIGGGGDNLIVSVQEATIAGGFGNTIHPDGRLGFLGGGDNNSVGVSGGTPSTSHRAVLVGGGQNSVRGVYSFLGGGFQNGMFIGCDYSVVSGGQANTIGVNPNNFSTHATISGGSSGLIQHNAHWSVIAGGLRNQILSGSTNSAIAGGEDNVIEANAPFGTILAGRDNHITGTGDYSTIAGVSNEVSAAYAMALGLTITNSTSASVEIGMQNTNKVRIDAQFTRMVNMGTLYMSNTVSWFPTASQIGVGGFWVGNSNGNLVTIYTLDGSATVMKVLAP